MESGPFHQHQACYLNWFKGTHRRMTCMSLFCSRVIGLILEIIKNKHQDYTTGNHVTNI